MPLLLLILFIFAEVNLSMRLAEALGTWGTLSWLLATAAVGIWLIRRQSAAALMRGLGQVAPDEHPGAALLQGLFRLLAGVLLFVPGIISDCLALVCLLPGVPQLLFRRWLARLAANGQFQVFGASSFSASSFGSNRQQPFGDTDSAFGGGNVYEHQGSAKVDDPEQNKLKAETKTPLDDQ